MDRTTFVASVQDALTNLYDRSYLAAHSLGGDFSGNRVRLSADQLHRILLDAIAQLRPAPSSPATSVAWRRYHYLDLRYREGWSHKTVAHQLGLSVRQAHRIRSEALEAVADALWKRDAYEGATAGRAVTGHSSAVIPSPRDSFHAQSTLDDEVARVGREEADSPADLIQEVDSIMETVELLTREHGVQVKVELPSESLTLSVGRGLLRQMLLLLISYALEYRADRQVYLTADQAEAATNLEIIFAKASSGPGSVAFQQDPRLITAQKLVETQGGSFKMIDGDEYTCLRLVLQPKKQFTVLTIDDNPDLGQLFDAYLLESRYHLLRAKTAQTALRLAKEVHPDIITLDVMMPFCDGWEIFHRLRANPVTKQIPVVVCSILPEKDLALALGANDFLAKPVTRQNLITTLNRCLPS